MKPSPPITMMILDLTIVLEKTCFFIKDFIFKEFLFVSEIIQYFFFITFSGALGQTRTGTPKSARILSPLCLPISPRGHYLFCLYINISLLTTSTFFLYIFFTKVKILFLLNISTKMNGIKVKALSISNIFNLMQPYLIALTIEIKFVKGS